MHFTKIGFICLICDASSNTLTSKNFKMVVTIVGKGMTGSKYVSHLYWEERRSFLAVCPVEVFAFEKFLCR